MATLDFGGQSGSRSPERRGPDRDARLLAREESFHTLANAIPQLVWIAYRDGRFSWCNDRWRQYTGLSLQDVRDYGWQQVLHPADLDRVLKSEMEAFARYAAWEDTVRMRRRDGVYRWFLLRALPLREEAVANTRWFGTCTDITDRIEAEARLRDSEARLRRIVDSGMVGVVYWDEHLDIVDANDAFLRLTGHTRSELEAGRLTGDVLVPERWREIAHRRVAEAMAADFTPPFEMEFQRPDGSVVPVLIAAASLQTETERGVAICIDIAKRREAELERERLLRLEQEARERAELATRTRDEVLTVVAHDLRNPLHTIQLLAFSMVDMIPTRDGREQQALKIQRVTETMDRQIGDLLDVARMEAGSFSITKTPGPFRALLDDAIATFQPQLDERELTLWREYAADLGTVHCDHAQMTRVLANLLANAIKFTPAGGTIAVRARRTDAVVEVAVADSGPGIPKEDLDRVFDRFWQADRKGRFGTGLGLAIARAVVEAHGGSIRAESTPGKGATIAFTIPVAAE